MKPSLLILGRGDSERTDRSQRRLLARAEASGFEARRCDYGEWATVDELRGDRVTVMPFFPYGFWNEVCERIPEPRLYGADSSTYGQFKAYLHGAAAELRARVTTRPLEFAFPLEVAALDRDKRRTAEQLRSQGVPLAQVLETRRVADVLAQAGDRRGVMIKCRYGAEGKGITRVRRNQWLTNYRVDGDRCVNHGRDERWPFVDITGRTRVLEELLHHEVVLEAELLAPNAFEGRKFDVRVYVVGRQAVHHLVRLGQSDSVVTNHSQGGVVRHGPSSGLPGPAIAAAERVACQAAAALGTSFAGVDVMFDGAWDAPVFLELQCFADFPSVDHFDLARYLSGALQSATLGSHSTGFAGPG